MLVKGILSFPCLFTAKKAKGSDVPKFSVTILLPPNDPQLPAIQQEVNMAIQNGYPSGMPVGTDCCFQLYDQKYQGKEYYDQRFSGWYALSCTAKAEDRPSVVDGTLQPIIDPAAIRPGHVGYVNLGISYYSKGKTGIGAWLNGIMFSGEESAMGMLDNKQTAEQMFSSVATGTGLSSGPATTPPPVTPPPVTPPPLAPVHQMTEKAAGATYEQMIQAGWTDELLITNSYMLPPGGAAPSFV